MIQGEAMAPSRPLKSLTPWKVPEVAGWTSGGMASLNIPSLLQCFRGRSLRPAYALEEKLCESLTL